MQSDKITITYLNYYDVYTGDNKLKPVFNSLFGEVEVSKPLVGDMYIRVIVRDIDRWIMAYKSMPTQNLVGVNVNLTSITQLSMGINNTISLNPHYKTKEEILRGGKVDVNNVVDRVSDYFKSVASLVREVDFESFMPSDAEGLLEYALVGVFPRAPLRTIQKLADDVCKLVDADFYNPIGADV